MMIVNNNVPDEIKKISDSPEQLKIIIAQQRLQIQEYKQQQKTSCKIIPVSFQKERESLLGKIKERDAEIEILREALRLARMRRFAASSEKLPSDQSELFNEAEVLSTENSEADTIDNNDITVPAHQRARGKRRPLPDNLPRKEVIIDLPENEKICAAHGKPLQLIGKEVSEKLEVIPAKITVIRTVVLKYINSCCQDEANIKTAPLPETILPKSNATPGLLAFIATSKYVDALPLYRQEQIFVRYGIELPRNTMARWMVGLKEPLLPLYRLMEEDLLASDYICCDETRTQVLKEKDKTPQSKSYMWVRTRHGPGISPIILFDYDPSRSGEVPNLLLAGFKGYLQVDGYAGYNEICQSVDVIRVGCMAHVRRKFNDVFKASKNKNKEAKKILLLIKSLYKIEKELQEKGVVERQETRLKQATPLLDEIKAWLDANQNRYPPSSLMGKAITYATNQWEYVINYLKDGRLDIDNNFTENRIRPFAIGRKNWMFNDTVEGAKASAMIYSILQTARANGHEPYAYMRYLLTELPKCKTAEQLELLLPHKIDAKVLN